MSFLRALLVDDIERDHGDADMATSKDDLNGYPHLLELATKAKWFGSDAFPVTDWVPEIERWLAYIDLQGQWSRFLPRLCANLKQRDETLAEILAAWYLVDRFGGRITEWEPMGPSGQPGEFVYETAAGNLIFVEVKSRGWQAGIVRSEGVASARLRDQKFKLGVESRWVDNWTDIREAVEKAYGKFPCDMPTMVLVEDNLWAGFTESDPSVKIALYSPKIANAEEKSYLAEDGSFVGRRHENLGLLSTLTKLSPGKYVFCQYPNLNCLSAVQVPIDAFPGATRVSPVGLLLPP